MTNPKTKSEPLSLAFITLVIGCITGYKQHYHHFWGLKRMIAKPCWNQGDAILKIEKG